MTKWPVQNLTHRTTQKHVQHHAATEDEIIPMYIHQVKAAVIVIILQHSSDSK